MGRDMYLYFVVGVETKFSDFFEEIEVPDLKECCERWIADNKGLNYCCWCRGDLHKKKEVLKPKIPGIPDDPDGNWLLAVEDFVGQLGFVIMESRTDIAAWVLGKLLMKPCNLLDDKNIKPISSDKLREMEEYTKNALKEANLFPRRKVRLFTCISSDF